mmetsp:Transcript_8221/g.25397  ORF Transcript_8221/g.25397 Transcript_8221/m.25397 type:complete len:739 (-) Transcript_8221:164-2380(-)
MLIGIIASLGGVTIQQVSNDKALARLKDELAELDRDFHQIGFTEFQRRSASLVFELSNGTIRTSSPPTEAEDAGDLMREYEREVRRAKRKVAELSRTNNKFRDFRDAYFGLVAQRAATAGDAHAANTTVRGGNGGTAAAVRRYDAELVTYSDAINDVRSRNNTSLTGLAVVTLASSLMAFILLTRFCALAQYETSQNEQALVTKNVELDIQRKILSQILHEMRNKYTAAAQMLEYFRDLRLDDDVRPRNSGDGGSSLASEIRQAKPDVTKALALLHEADALVSTRLTLHRLFAGTYSSETQTVDLRLLLQNRVDVASPLANTGVQFDMGVPPSYEGLDAAVKLDLFIFSHLANNLLSNARKHTLKGRVDLTFKGIFAADTLPRASAESSSRRSGGGSLSRGWSSLTASLSSSKSKLTTDQKKLPPCVGGSSSMLLTTGSPRSDDGKKAPSAASSPGGSQDTDCLVFAVTDTGRGVPPNVADRLFEEEVSTGDQRGVGLGLVSCRQFAHAIGGDVWLHETTVQTVETSAASGTEFRFALPGKITFLEKDDAVPRVAEAVTATHGDEAPVLRETTDAIAEPVDDDSKAMRAIIVEDSALIRKGLVVKLRKVGSKLGKTFNFEEHATVEAFLSATADDAALTTADCLILIDENLNAAGGILRGRDLVKHLRANDFQGIVVSASGDDESLQVHRDLGADLIWTKPFGNVDVMAAELGAEFHRRDNLASAPPPAPPCGDDDAV